MSKKSVSFWLFVLMILGLASILSVFDPGHKALAQTTMLDESQFETDVLPDGVTASHAVTIEKRLTLDDDLSETDQVVWLTKFMTAPKGAETSRVALGLAFAPVNTGWFGPMWGLHIVSDIGLIERGNISDGSTFTEGTVHTSLYSSPPRWGHEYEVALSYDPQSGASGVVIHDLTTNETLLTRNLQLHPFTGTLYANTDESQVRKGFVPAPLQWWLVQPDESNDRYLPATSIDRRKEAAISLRNPWSNFPGHLTLVLTEDTGQNVVVTSVDAHQGRTTFSVTDLPAGRYTGSLHYNNGVQSWVIDEKEFFVGTVSSEVSRIEVVDDVEEPLLRGILSVTADGPLSNVTVGLETLLVRHGFTYDPARARGVMSESVEWDVWVPTAIVDLEADREVQTDFHIRLPVDIDGEPRDLWEIVVRPRIDPPQHLTRTRDYRTWISSTDSDEWRPFLQDEHVYKEHVSPGIERIYIKGRTPSGPMELHLVTVDLSHPSVRVDALVGADFLAPATSRWPRSQPSQMVAASGAKLGVNADFFDIRDSMVPRGIVVQSGDLLKAETTGYVSIGFTPDNVAYVGKWHWQGAVAKADGSGYRVLHGLNAQKPALGLTLFRSPAHVTLGTIDPGDPVVEVVLEETVEIDKSASSKITIFSDTARRIRGIVREIRIGEPKMMLSPGWMVLSGRGEHGRYLKQTFDVGDEVDVYYDIVGASEWPYLEEPSQLYAAVAGNVLLLKEGRYGDQSQVVHSTVRHPRTAVGISRDQQTLYILVVDGRSPRSIGMTYQELADFFRHVGAFHAVNLDGGGSSALVINETMNGPAVLNVPSDGRQRYVPVGLGVFWIEKE